MSPSLLEFLVSNTYAGCMVNNKNAYIVIVLPDRTESQMLLIICINTPETFYSRHARWKSEAVVVVVYVVLSSLVWLSLIVTKMVTSYYKKHASSIVNFSQEEWEEEEGVGMIVKEC